MFYEDFFVPQRISILETVYGRFGENLSLEKIFPNLR